MEKESLLVVEDESILRDALVDYFSSEGHKVDAAADGDIELRKYNLADYDIMIIDLRLPGRDGISVLKEVKKINPKAKVIIVTGYPSQETRTEALQTGAINYLPKPFEISYLEKLIRESYEIDRVHAPAIEEPPVVEEEIITPCVWMQAGISKKRMCTEKYECKACNFHTAMMAKEEFRTDPRIQPYLHKMDARLGKNQCRYIMSGELSYRNCSKLFHCYSCELGQMIEYKIDHQLALKEERKKMYIAEQMAKHGQTEKN